jgi:tight adherence protein C
MMSIIMLVLLVVVLITAVVAAIGSLQAAKRRTETLSRVRGVDPTIGAKVPLITLKDPETTVSARLGRLAERVLPTTSGTDSTSNALVQAGFESPEAPAIFALLRLISALAVPGAMFMWGPTDSSLMLVMSGGIGIALGLGGPSAILSRMQSNRQDRIRKSIPDSLDLLLVCVEAGVSLDAAILRVGREMLMLHPELSAEFLTMNRRMNAGMRREEALHGLYQRTGVEELRALGSNMIQSEKWGTSIAKVLRVYSEALRRKRRQAAEKKAAVAATKMIFPLALFILPALFAVIGGPAALAIGPVLDALGGK